MIRWILHKGTRKFERRYQYDARYLHDIIQASPNAGLRMGLLPLFSQFQGPKPARGVWAGAIFASTLEGDCGPCAQLVLDIAKDAGVNLAALRKCVQGRAADAGDVGLGFRFAMAAISGDAAADELRGVIAAKYGDAAVVAASFGAAFGRVYPVLKRGMGHGALCQSLVFGQEGRVEIEA